jgi:hypothetical protein
MARHALVDISQIFNTSPLEHDGLRLTDDELAQLRAHLSAQGLLLSEDAGDAQTLRDLRALYEPYTQVLSQYLMMPLPGWMPKPRASDNWQTSAWEVTALAPDRPFQKCMLKDRPAHRGASLLQKED